LKSCAFRSILYSTWAGEEEIRTRLLTIAAVAVFGVLSVRADDPNPEVAKVIEKIAERLAAKEDARIRQTETWQKGELRERKGVPGTGFGAAPGAPANPAPAK